MQADDTILREIEAQAMEMARGAGQILESYFGGPMEVEFKGDNKSDPVCKADKESEEFLRGSIKRRFPDHGILGEEGTEEEGHSPFTWVLDPLDGTINYINGLPFYGVSVGVLRECVPVVGCVWVPWSGTRGGTVYNARLGHGAFLDGRAISVRKNPAPQPGQLAIFHREFRLLYHRNAGGGAPVGEGRGPGSLAYELALTSNGVFQYAVFSSPRIWDVAAGIVLVKEAGGSILAYNRIRRRWQEMMRIDPPGRGADSEAAGLRKWSSPIMAGNGELVEYLARFARPWGLGRFLGRLIGR